MAHLRRAIVEKSLFGSTCRCDSHNFFRCKPCHKVWRRHSAYGEFRSETKQPLYIASYMCLQSHRLYNNVLIIITKYM
jgi:hypothetical protein